MENDSIALVTFRDEKGGYTIEKIECNLIVRTSSGTEIYGIAKWKMSGYDILIGVIPISKQVLLIKKENGMQ